MVSQSLSAPSLVSSFRSKRAELRLGLRAVAAITGVSFSTLSRFERGAELMASNRERIEAWIAGHPIPVAGNTDSEVIRYLEGLGFVRKLEER